MRKNTGSQKAIFYAFDATTGLPKTGDAANITAYVSKDWGAVTVLDDTSATELEATNAAGYYTFDLTQAETNANVLLFTAKSSTADIVVIGAPAVVVTDPATGVLAPATADRTLSVASTGHAAIDLGNVGNPTAANTFSGTIIGSVSVLNNVPSPITSSFGLLSTAQGLGNTTLATISTAVAGADGYTLPQVLALQNSALFGKSSGNGTGSPVYRDVGDTKDRIAGTTDANGNRTAVTLDAT